MSLFKPLCKFCASIRTIREIVPTVRKALAIAQSGTPGPVFIEFPIDTLYPFHLVSKEFGVKNPPKGLMGTIVTWYVTSMTALCYLVYLECKSCCVRIVNWLTWEKLHGIGLTRAQQPNKLTDVRFVTLTLMNVLRAHKSTTENSKHLWLESELNLLYNLELSSTLVEHFPL